MEKMININAITHKLQVSEPLDVPEQEFALSLMQFMECEYHELPEIFMEWTRRIRLENANKNRLTLGEDETAVL